jgi:hypothetical protein
VPELWEVRGAAKIRCLGPAEALARLDPPAGVGAGRVASDEVLWLGDPGRAGELEAAARSQLADAEGSTLVVDHSDGWTLLSIVGDRAEEALARVSSLRVPEGGGFIQGQIAHAPGKVFCRPGRLDVLVGSDLAWFVRERLLHAGHALGLHAAGAPEAAPVSNGERVTA